ncbi:hypothetical protein Cri9333_2986 [Crinalium epipsammum PCC 9333]|uniref:Uncharacterized protein n=1 Tax=Crinalium epipsammum PCC 9333 TaxID=1173022 RepID=K9W314_9CYAN|nr:hypothetical protein Cri9333_2986 [Crinalium epipsammum PCC 9333]
MKISFLATRKIYYPSYKLAIPIFDGETYPRRVIYQKKQIVFINTILWSLVFNLFMPYIYFINKITNF